MALPKAPVRPGLSARSLGRLDDEAFFSDEWGARTCASGLRENKFAVGANKNGRVLAANPLLDPAVPFPELNGSERAELAKVLARQPDEATAVYQIHVPAAFSAARAKVTLLYGVGSEIPRHGLRLMFEGNTSRVLVLVSGREGGAGGVGHAWGYGITDSIIQQLFAAAGLSGLDFVVDVIACFSTGYRGMIGTINNFAASPATLDLTQVNRIVVFDALYTGTEPAPGDGYKRALATMNTITGGRVQLVVYDVTPGGTPWQNGDTRVSQSFLTTTFGNRYLLRHLQTQASLNALAALSYARMFDAAVKDGYFPATVLSPAMQECMKWLPPRNSVESIPVDVSTGPTRGITLRQWWAIVPGDGVAKVQADLDTLRKEVVNNRNFFFLCWMPKDVPDSLHDMHIRELAWEFLV